LILSAIIVCGANGALSAMSPRMREQVNKKMIGKSEK
jgi:hypothetical protein